MDLATLLGLIIGLGLIAGAVIIGGSPGAFFDIPSVLIVVFGTFAVTTISFSVTEIITSQGLWMKGLFNKNADPSEAAHDIVQLAERARKEGVLALQQSLSNLEDIPFLFKGLSLVVDGTSAEEVEKLMKTDIMSMAGRHLYMAGVMTKASEVAPAMGLIGTLIGLVQMLGNLDDPSAIGPAMAVALLTTMYGAILANMVFSPLAAKLTRNSNEEVLLNKVYLMGAVSIGRQENPRRLEMMLNAVLPPTKRISYFED